VHAFALRRTTAADADDLLAEVFLAAWRRLDEDPADALPWLLGSPAACSPTAVVVTDAKTLWWQG
jgi:hypothetical protein